MTKFVQFEGRIFDIEQIAYIGLVEHPDKKKYNIYVLLKCYSVSLIHISQFFEEKEAKNYIAQCYKKLNMAYEDGVWPREWKTAEEVQENLLKKKGEVDE